MREKYTEIDNCLVWYFMDKRQQFKLNSKFIAGYYLEVHNNYIEKSYTKSVI